MSPSCGVCLSSYDGEEKKPLVLPCGHTFCKSCVPRFRNNRCNVCPVCRKRSKTNISDLPINYQLLEYSNQETNISSQFLCKLHSKHLYIMCRTCDTLVCWQCANLTHQDCDVGVPITCREKFETSVELHVQDMKKIGNGRIERYEELEKSVDEVLLEIEDFKMKLLEFKRSISEASHNLKKNLKSLDHYRGSVSCLTDEQFLKEGHFYVQKVADHNRSTVLPRLDAELITKVSDLFSKLSDSVNSINLSPIKNNSFNEGKTWYLNSKETILAASNVLNDTSKRPSALAIDVNSITDTTIVKRFLSNRSFGYNVGLRCFDESLTPDENRQKLQDIIKCLSKDRIETKLVLNGFSTLTTVKSLQEEFGNKVRMKQLGIASEDDVDLLKNLKLTSARVLRSVDPKALKQLPQSDQYYRYPVHFPPLSDSDIDWLSAVIDKLYTESLWPDIYLKKSTLTRSGLDRLVGILRDKFRTSDVNLYVQTSLIPDSTKNNYQIGKVFVNWIDVHADMGNATVLKDIEPDTTTFGNSLFGRSQSAFIRSSSSPVPFGFPH